MYTGRRTPTGGFRSLMRMPAWLHILRLLLAIPILALTRLRRVLAAAALALTLTADFAACALTRRYDMGSRGTFALEAVADFLIQAALLLCLAPRLSPLRIPAYLLPVQLLVLLIAQLAPRHSDCGRESSMAEKILGWIGSALLMALLLVPGMGPGTVWALAMAQTALMAASILLNLLRIRNSRRADAQICP